MTHVAHITLLFAAVLDLFAMLYRDTLTLQEENSDNSQYFKWLKNSGEFTSIKRLLAVAILFGVFTTMAQVSWIVVLILAIALAAQALYLLPKKQTEPSKLAPRSKRVYLLAGIISAALSGAIGSLTGHLTGADPAKANAIIAIIALIISPLIIIVCNGLLPGANRHSSNSNENGHFKSE